MTDILVKLLIKKGEIYFSPRGEINIAHPYH